MRGRTPVIEIVNKRIVVDGKPRIVLAGEIHYFRVARADWADRIGKLKGAGCNAVASYIPWLLHERADGTFDLEGRTDPSLDLGAFIDLCQEQGLWFLARPGPFIMAEMKNEGLPYRLYTDHPEIIPVSWDGNPASTRTVDYLAPAFLDECRRWYAAVMPVLAARLKPAGGNVIAVQLDNEIGMLSWVTNSPDLTDGVISDLGAWVQGRYTADELADR
jgi:beta-galactosidase